MLPQDPHQGKDPQGILARLMEHARQDAKRAVAEALNNAEVIAALAEVASGERHIFEAAMLELRGLGLPVREVDALTRSVNQAAKKGGDERGKAAISAAVEEHLRERIQGTAWLPSTLALRFTWRPTGEEVCWRVLEERHLREDALRTVGPLERFAWGIDKDAKPRSIMIALQAIAMDVQLGEGLPDSGLEEEDRPTRLVRALLFGPIEITRETSDGRPYRLQTTVAESPGHYPGFGVGLTWNDDTERSGLVVNLTTAAIKVLRDNPDFGRKSPAWLARRLREYDGFITSRLRVRRLRTGRWWALDVTTMLADPRGDNVWEGDPEAVRAFARGEEVRPALRLA